MQYTRRQQCIYFLKCRFTSRQKKAFCSWAFFPWRESLPEMATTLNTGFPMVAITHLHPVSVREQRFARSLQEQLTAALFS